MEAIIIGGIIVLGYALYCLGIERGRYEGRKIGREQGREELRGKIMDHYGLER